MPRWTWCSRDSARWESKAKIASSAGVEWLSLTKIYSQHLLGGIV